MRKHTTRDGDTMYISQMEDSHLINTIKYIIRKGNDAKEALMTDLSGVNSILYGSDIQVDKERMKSIIKKVPELLEPYILEAVIRSFDFTEIRDSMSDFFERSEVLPLPRRNQSLDYIGDGAEVTSYYDMNKDNETPWDK